MYAKGESGNLRGRPKGSVNKTTLELRDKLNNLHQKNYEYILKEIDNLTMRQRLQLNKDLLPYISPKLSAIEVTDNNMSYEELAQYYQLKESVKLLSTDELIKLLDQTFLVYLFSYKALSQGVSFLFIARVQFVTKNLHQSNIYKGQLQSCMARSKLPIKVKL